MAGTLKPTLSKGTTKGGWSPTLKGSGPLRKGGFKPIMKGQAPPRNGGPVTYPPTHPPSGREIGGGGVIKYPSGREIGGGGTTKYPSGRATGGGGNLQDLARKRLRKLQ